MNITKFKNKTHSSYGGFGLFGFVLDFDQRIVGQFLNAEQTLIPKFSADLERLPVAISVDFSACHCHFFKKFKKIIEISKIHDVFCLL